MKLSLIAAMSNNHIIGNKNDIPWSLPDDFKYFKAVTQGHYVIMGRKNWESLPDKFRPLPNRHNIILTRQKNYHADGGIVLSSLDAAFQLVAKESQKEVFIIGGGEIYRLALDLAHKIYLTEIDAEIKGEVTFPHFLNKEWKEIFRKHHPADQRHMYSFDFVIYEKYQPIG